MQGVLSLQQMTIPPGSVVSYLYNTNGALARGEHAENLIAGNFDAILMIDLDMIHPQDLLIRLQDDIEKNNFDMVTAHYFRRTMPPLSVCSLPSKDGDWPYPPLLDVPDKGFVELSNTGMGCVLIKTEVVRAVWDTLPPKDNPFYPRPMPDYCGDHRQWGSDFAFFTMARTLGYKLWLDAGVESKHGAIVWIDRMLYTKFKAQTEEYQRQTQFDFFKLRSLRHGMNSEQLTERLTYLRAYEPQLEIAAEKKRKELRNAEDNLLATQAQIAEVEFLLAAQKEHENEIPGEAQNGK